MVDSTINNNKHTLNLDANGFGKDLVQFYY